SFVSRRSLSLLCLRFHKLSISHVHLFLHETEQAGACEWKEQLWCGWAGTPVAHDQSAIFILDHAIEARCRCGIGWGIHELRSEQLQAAITIQQLDDHVRIPTVDLKRETRVQQKDISA